MSTDLIVGDYVLFAYAGIKWCGTILKEYGDFFKVRWEDNYTPSCGWVKKSEVLLQPKSEVK